MKFIAIEKWFCFDFKISDGSSEGNAHNTRDNIIECGFFFDKSKYSIIS